MASSENIYGINLWVCTATETTTFKHLPEHLHKQSLTQTVQQLSDVSPMTRNQSCDVAVNPSTSLSFTLSLSCPTSYPAPWEHTWESRGKWSQNLGSCHSHRRPGWSARRLASICPSPSCCNHLGSKPANGRMCVCVSLPLCVSLCLSNKQHKSLESRKEESVSTVAETLK